MSARIRRAVEQHGPLYALEAFGLRNPMIAWAIEHAGLNGFCRRCRGDGFLVRSPCFCRAFPEGHLRADGCTHADGCSHCRRVCPECKGRMLAPDYAVHYEDFGDLDSLEAARRMFPDLEPAPTKRSDREAPALGR